MKSEVIGQRLDPDCTACQRPDRRFRRPGGLMSSARMRRGTARQRAPAAGARAVRVAADDAAAGHGSALSAHRPLRNPPCRIFAASAWGATCRICAQMFQFWRPFASQMTRHQVGRTTVDRSLFREQSNHALARQDAARRPTWARIGHEQAIRANLAGDGCVLQPRDGDLGQDLGAAGK